MAGPLAVIAANAVRYVVSGSARRALTKVIAEINKHYAKSKRKPTAEAIRDRAKRMVEKGKAERSKLSKEIKQGGAFSQTSAVPLRLKGSGNVIPKTKTKIGSIPLKRNSKGKYSIKPQPRKKGLGQRTTIGKDKHKQREIPVTGSTSTRGGVSVAERKKALSRVSKIAAAAKRNKGKLLVGAVATGVAVSALKDKGKKKTTTTKTSGKTTTKKSTRTFDRKNFPNPKNLENYKGRRGGINVRKKKKK